MLLKRYIFAAPLPHFLSFLPHHYRTFWQNYWCGTAPFCRKNRTKTWSLLQEQGSAVAERGQARPEPEHCQGWVALRQAWDMAGAEPETWPVQWPGLEQVQVPGQGQGPWQGPGQSMVKT